MVAHLRANLVLAVGTMGLCCILSPLALLGLARLLFPAASSGSLGARSDGQIVGSSQIAQPFSGDEYFQPRPSGVGYNAAGSGGSNWGASNPKLRDRAARILGPIVRFDTPTGRD